MTLPLRSRLFRLLSPWVGREPIFAIGIYHGPSPLALTPANEVVNPVLCAADVTDVPAHFVADPFMIRVGESWHMFFEVLNRDLNRGQIGWASSSDGLRWRYERIVLAEKVHLSFPHIFEHDGAYYMLPETFEAGAVRLYKAARFPDRWAYECDLLVGADYYDSSLIRHGGRWWLFTGTNTARSDTLRLFSAPALHGPYAEHPASPLIAGDPTIARLGGPIVAEGERLYRLTQDCAQAYGLHVRVFEITTLTPERYAEREALGAPLVGPAGSGWNADGMHHIGLHPRPEGGWIACVDGYKRVFYAKGRPLGEAH